MELFLGITCISLVLVIVILSVLLWKALNNGEKFEQISKNVMDYEKFSETIAELVLIIPVALRASNQIQNFENFFEDSLEDMASVLDMLDNLMKRQTISDDSDVQNLYRVMGIAHDILLGYKNNGRNREAQKE